MLDWQAIHMTDFCEHRAFFEEAMSFYKSAQIVQESDYRVDYEEIDLFGPVEYSCAVKPPIRQTGNRLSGLTETANASLLA